MVKWERNLIGGTRNVHVWHTRRLFVKKTPVPTMKGLFVQCTSPRGTVRVYPNVGGKKGFIMDLQINNEKHPRGFYQQKAFKTRVQANDFVKKYMKSGKLNKLRKMM